MLRACIEVLVYGLVRVAQARLRVALFVAIAAPAFAAEPPRNVLVLYADNRLIPGIAVVDEAFNAQVRAQMGLQVGVFNEFLDLDRLSRGDYREQLVRLLQEKYADTRFDAIVAVRGPALEFVLQHRSRLFTGVPVVHASLTARELAGKTLPPDVIGAATVHDPARTLELALRIHPGTESVVVITGASEFDRAWERQLREAFRPFEQRVKVDYWAGLPMAEILDRVPRLAPGTVVYGPVMMQDGTGQRFVPRQVVAELAQMSRVPMYTPYSPTLGTGVVGGYMAPLEDVGRLAADLVVRLLKGEPPQSIVAPAAVPNAYLLDARQLRRFGVRESDLPAGAVLKFREPTLWEEYRWQIVGLAVALLLQAALIAALLVQRGVRRRAEANLLESRQRMGVVAAATGLGMWVEEVPRRAFWASREHRALLGIGESEPYDFERLLRAVHPDDRGPVREAVESTAATASDCDIRYRVPLADGTLRWVGMRGRAEVDARGRVVRIRGVSVDVTARQEAEVDAQRHRNELARLSRVAMLGQLSGSLAHELNQPLTAILSNAQAALRFLRADAPDLDELREILSDIVVDDRRAGDVIHRLRALFERGEARQEPVDLNELVREILRLLHSDLVSRNVAVATDLEWGLPTVCGDRVQLQQLLLNLVLNACEAMADTPVSGRQLKIGTASAGAAEIVVSVADCGKGIPPDELETVFEPFVTSKDLGIGLGLAIGRSIVVAHGGRLWASANDDGGATFRFTLRVQAAAAASAPPGEHGRAPLAAAAAGP